MFYTVTYLSVFTISCLRTQVSGKYPGNLSPISEASRLGDSLALAPPGEEGFLEIQKLFKETNGRVIFSFWDKGEEHFSKERPFENTIREKNWKVINGEKWKIVTLDSLKGSKWNARDIITYAKDKGHVDFDLMDLAELKRRNIGDIAKTPQYYSDMVRLSFLEAFGGTWVDTSVIMTDSFDNMFFSQLQAQKHKTLAGFTLSMHGSQKHKFADGLENWFLMAKKGSKPLREWRRNTWKYIEESPERTEAELDESDKKAAKKAAAKNEISIFDRPLFKADSKASKAEKALMKEVQASIRMQPKEYRNYLWGYSAWKRAIIEHPEFQDELLLREAGPEKYGPLGHEHLLDHIGSQKRGGESAMFGANRQKIAKRARLKAAGDPRYANFMALKFPSVIAGFRSDKVGDKPKYSKDDYAERSLIADLTEQGKKNAQKEAQFLEEGSFFREAMEHKRSIRAGKFKDMPGGLLFRFGYPLFLVNRWVWEKIESFDSTAKRSGEFYDKYRDEIQKTYQDTVEALEKQKDALPEGEEKKRIVQLLEQAEQTKKDFDNIIGLSQSERRNLLNHMAIEQQKLKAEGKSLSRSNFRAGMVIGVGITAGVIYGIEQYRQKKEQEDNTTHASSNDLK